MNDKHIFVDTNILVYAHDKQGKDKHDIAKEKITELWMKESPPSLSIQVLQELYVNLVRKNVTEKDVRAIVVEYLVWEVIPNDQELFMAGIKIKERFKLSFWDSLIIAAAQRAHAHIIWSEDLQNGQDFEGVVVINPLIS
ncbi:MAG: PIN domain-containing protein [Deltaproteobacteria bacterium]|nr:PIN domain-containing protein [Deltaproteobacteria bacterium]